MKMKITGIDENRLKDFVVAVRQIKSIEFDRLCLAASAASAEEDTQERDEARRILIEQYLKNVIMIAARYRGSGLSFAELIREGNVGLISASRTMNAERASDFDGYICDAIEGAVIGAVLKNKKEGKAQK